MRMLTTAAAAVLLTASTAQAGVITLGTWRPMIAPSDHGETFFDHRSWDGPHKGVAWLIEPGWEYLGMPGGAPAAWRIEGLEIEQLTDLGGISALFDVSSWSVLPGGVLAYDTGPAYGHTFTSLTEDGLYMLLTRFVTATSTIYDVWVEDLRLLDILYDGDHNDRRLRVQFRVETPPVYIPPGDDVPLPSVPEPASLTLAALGLAVWTLRRRWR